MMKLPLALILAGVAATVTLPAHVSANPGNEATVVIHDVDFRGRPPFNRSRERLPLTDVARLEAENAQTQTTLVRTTDFKGRPPFKRNAERVEVVDVALFGLTDQGDEGARKFRSRGAGLKRY